jgi:hypothetical protein
MLQGTSTQDSICWQLKQTQPRKEMATKTEHKLFDSLITGGSIRNDRDLARELNVAPPVISKIRNLKLELGDSMRVRIMRRFGLTMRRVDELAPPGATAE